MLKEIFFATFVTLAFGAESETKYSDNLYADIKFSVPDLNVKHNVEGTNVLLQAYKIDNTMGTNLWVSIGYPYFIKNREGEYFSFDTENIFLHLRLLPRDQAAALENLANSLYGIKNASIHLIPLQSITCKVTIDWQDVAYQLIGTGYNLDQYDVTMVVPCRKGTNCRQAFDSRQKKTAPLYWKCTFEADAQEKFVDRLEITAKTIQNASITHNLFGPLDTEVYVTRNQMSHFTQEVCNDLQILEEYETDERFSAKIYDQLISAANITFKFVPIGEALKKLSPLGLSMNVKDLTADSIDDITIRNLTSNAADEYHSNKDDRENSNSQLTSSSSSVSGGFHANFKGFGGGVSGGVSKELMDSFNKGDLSAREVLNILNSNNRAQYEYKNTTKQFIAKNISVTLISTSMLESGLSISYRRIVRKNAAYKFKMQIKTGGHSESIREQAIKERLRGLTALVKRFNNIKNERLVEKMCKSKNSTTIGRSTGGRRDNWMTCRPDDVKQSRFMDTIKFGDDDHSSEATCCQFM